MGNGTEKTKSTFATRASKKKKKAGTPLRCNTCGLWKGEDAFAIKRVAQIIQGLGYRKIIFKSDQGFDICALKRAVRRECSDVEIILEANRLVYATQDSSMLGMIKVLFVVSIIFNE